METKKCPFCAEEIALEAVKCKHCHSELPNDKELSEEEIDEQVNDLLGVNENPETYSYEAAKYWGWVFRIGAILYALKELIKNYGSGGSMSGGGRYYWLVKIADATPEGLVLAMIMISECYLLLSLREHYVRSRRSLAVYIFIPLIQILLYGIWSAGGMSQANAALITTLMGGGLGIYALYDVFIKHNKAGFVVGFSSIYFAISMVESYFDLMDESDFFITSFIPMIWGVVAYLWAKFISEYLVDSPRYATPSDLDEGVTIGGDQYKSKKWFSIVTYIIFGILALVIFLSDFS